MTLQTHLHLLPTYIYSFLSITQKLRLTAWSAKLILNRRVELYHMGLTRPSCDPSIEFLIFHPPIRIIAILFNKHERDSADGVKLKMEPHLNLLQKIKYPSVGDVKFRLLRVCPF